MALSVSKPSQHRNVLGDLKVHAMATPRSAAEQRTLMTSMTAKNIISRVNKAAENITHAVTNAFLWLLFQNNEESQNNTVGNNKINHSLTVSVITI